MPTNQYLKSDFIYFLIQTNDLLRLAQVFSLWINKDTFDTILWAGFAEGSSLLNHEPMKRLALQLFYEHLNENQYDPYWLINFKDSLESTYFPEQAWAIAHEAWSSYIKLLVAQTTPVDYLQLLNYIKLSMQEAPGDKTGEALTLLQHFTNPSTELLMLSWAIKTHNHALADAIYAYYKLKDMLPPAWTMLSLALLHEDRYLMRDLLTHAPLKISSRPTKVASYRDKIQAAVEIDDLSMAQQNAFEAMEKHPNDSDLYDHFFTPSLFKTANTLSIAQDFFQYATVEGPRSIGRLTYHPTPSLSLTPSYSIWFSNQLKPIPIKLLPGIALSTQTITNIPNHDEREGLQLTMAQHRGDLILDVGHRADLNAFQTLRIQRQYQVVHDLNTVLDVGYHQPAEDSLGLLVGGMKNNVHLLANYRLSAENVLMGDYFQNFFYTQSGSHVADGLQATLNLEHRFTLD